MKQLRRGGPTSSPVSSASHVPLGAASWRRRRGGTAGSNYGIESRRLHLERAFRSLPADCQTPGCFGSSAHNSSAAVQPRGISCKPVISTWSPTANYAKRRGLRRLRFFLFVLLLDGVLVLLFDVSLQSLPPGHAGHVFWMYRTSAFCRVMGFPLVFATGSLDSQLCPNSKWGRGGALYLRERRLWRRRLGRSPSYAPRSQPKPQSWLTS